MAYPSPRPWNVPAVKVPELSTTVHRHDTEHQKIKELEKFQPNFHSKNSHRNPMSQVADYNHDISTTRPRRKAVNMMPEWTLLDEQATDKDLSQSSTKQLQQLGNELAAAGQYPNGSRTKNAAAGQYTCSSWAMS